MNQYHNVLDQRMLEFRRKYYTDKLIRGSLLLALLVSSILFVLILSEGLFRFSASVRTAMVFGLGAIFLGVLGYMVIWPIFQLMNWSSTISDFQIAKMVKSHFPDINDKLINLLELKEQEDMSGALAMAAIDKKAEFIAPVKLSSAINLNVNRRYLWYLAIPIFLYALTAAFDPALLSTSTNRLINYNQEFVPPPPFEIQLNAIPSELVAGQDYDLSVKVNGEQLPSELYIFMKDDSEPNGQFIDFTLDQKNATDFGYTFTDVKDDFSFYIGNPEVNSKVFPVKVMKRPFIQNFK
ncbi:MAG: hypothetical protein AAF206_32285, partial [Bacteroidota bacterium]